MNPAELLAHYEAMRAAALPRLAQGAPELDMLLDDPTDTRRGLTLLARPPAALVSRIEAVLADFQRVEPAQYYQPAPDLHLTILSIISCYAGFQLADVTPARYGALVAEALHGTPPLAVELRGLTASAGGVLVQGFPVGDGLARLRDELRRMFRASELRQSIDQRYSIQTAHLTVARFRQPLANAAGLLAQLAAYHAYPFGRWEITGLELVYNDWYQRAAHTTWLGHYALQAAGGA